MTNSNIIKNIIISVTLLAGSVTASFGERARVSKELEGVDPEARVNVIVRFRRVAGPEEHQMIRDLGGSVKSSLGSIQGGAYAIPGSALHSLALNPEVLSISPDREVHMLLDNTVAAVNAPAAWNAGLDGSGIGIAVIDSGI